MRVLVSGSRLLEVAVPGLLALAGCTSEPSRPGTPDVGAGIDGGSGQDAGDAVARDASTSDAATRDAGTMTQCGAHASGPDCSCDEGYVLDVGACRRETCAQQDCSGHGRCTDDATGPRCSCDEGFVGEACAEQGEDFHRRTLLVSGMADPDILKETDDLFVLTGTAPGSAVIPLYETSDLLTFQERPAYDPTALDPDHDYCYLWAPDLTKYGGHYDLYFSAHRVAQGAACPPPSGQEVTTFHASAPTLELAFGIPALVDEGPGLPRSRIESGCGDQGCLKTVRIDSAAYDDGVDRWFFYVWFSGGNNIASYRFAAPQTVLEHAGPASFAIQPYEEQINEGPDVFRRNGKLYMFFSGGFFNSQYAMYYIMADSVSELTRARSVRRHSEPVRAGSGHFLETHGHNSIVERRGEFFNVFHQGKFNESGSFSGRSTYKQRISFRDDGSIVALNYVDLGWSQMGDARYSLDVITRDGKTHGPCLGESRLGTSTTVRFHGVCPDAGDALVPMDQVAKFRIYHSADGTWDGARSAELAYDGASDRAFIPIGGGHTARVSLRWNELATGMEYSLDVQRRDGSWVAPCVGAATLAHAIEHEFTGACTSPGSNVAPADIQAFRVCAAADGQWQSARCGTTPYDGAAGFSDIRIP
jgi:hypothetical protein